MHPQVIRDQPGTCPICGMELTPLKTGGGAAAPAGERKVVYWWDPMMSPPYISDKPGKSPMGMDLVPVYEDEVAAGSSIVIDPTIVQNMGVRVATAHEGPLRRTIRAVGYLAEAQPNQHDVNLRVSGWIEKLYADVEGMHVQAGAPLFELYSPELQVAIEELIAARRARDALGPRPERQRAGAQPTSSLATAERKLELLGLEPRTGARVRRGSTRRRRRSRSPAPITGHVVEKPIVDGAAVRGRHAGAAHRRPFEPVARHRALRAAVAVRRSSASRPAPACSPFRAGRSTARSASSTRTSTPRRAR